MYKRQQNYPAPFRRARAPPRVRRAREAPARAPSRVTSHSHRRRRRASRASSSRRARARRASRVRKSPRAKLAHLGGSTHRRGGVRASRGGHGRRHGRHHAFGAGSAARGVARARGRSATDRVVDKKASRVVGIVFERWYRHDASTTREVKKAARLHKKMTVPTSRSYSSARRPVSDRASLTGRRPAERAAAARRRRRATRARDARRTRDARAERRRAR